MGCFDRQWGIGSDFLSSCEAGTIYHGGAGSLATTIILYNTGRGGIMPASEAFYAKVTLGSRICKETVAAASDTIPPEEEAACQLGGGTDVCGRGEKRKSRHSQRFPFALSRPIDYSSLDFLLSFEMIKKLSRISYARFCGCLNDRCAAIELGDIPHRRRPQQHPAFETCVSLAPPSGFDFQGSFSKFGGKFEGVSHFVDLGISLFYSGFGVGFISQMSSKRDSRD